jgi:polyisoprenyl-teichoic acid--peptidoglycan teichoic acid transferase
MTTHGPYDHEQDETQEHEEREAREGGDAGGVTEEFEAEFGDEFGADVAGEPAPDEPSEEVEQEEGAEGTGDPAGADAGASEADDRSGEAERAGAEQPAGIDAETVEADVLSLGDEEAEREQAAKEAGAALEAKSGGDGAAAEDHESEGEEGEEGEEAEAEEAGAAVATAEAPPVEEGEPPQPEPAPEVAAEEDQPPKVGLWPRFMAASLVIVISIATATSVTLLLELTDLAKGLGGIKGVQGQLESVPGGDPQNILILGSDKRPDLKGDPGRSDTTMLLRLDPEGDAIALLSLPRDLKVNIPGHGIGKLNDAYTVGGPKETLEVVKQLTGLKIQHVVNVDFQGFEQAINAIDCVYVDVDRRYFNSNEGLAPDQLYAEIDIQAGYQMLCGDRALQYVRYRHTDNDIVRSARQQDFLREARQKIGIGRLFRDRDKLLGIFKKYTTSDIEDTGALVSVLKTFLAAADAPVKQIHFQGTLGESYVTASNEQIQTAVKQFLGLEDTPGGLGEEGGGKGKEKEKKKKPKPGGGGGPALIDATGSTVPWAQRFAPEVGFPVFYPTQLAPETTVSDESREYKIADEDGKVHTAYKYVFSIPGTNIPAEYYGLMGTTWTDPPILDNPSETREIGGREYDLFFDGDRLRMVAWRTDKASYWLNNTLLQTLEEDEMLAIAQSMDEVAPPKPKKKK